MAKAPPKIFVSQEADVFGFKVQGNILVCLYHEQKKAGGALLISSNLEDIAKLKELVETLRAGLDADTADFIAKLVGPSPLIQKLKNILVEQNIYVASSCPQDSNALDVYFYSDTGRLRVGESANQELKAIAPQLELVKTKEIAPQAQEKIRVLVVDDSLTIRKILEKVLSEDHGFKIVGSVENPIKAHEFLKTNTVDVITLDIHMPEMDGITYLETLKGKKHAPIVMISSVNKEDAVKALRCFELGAVGYIEKPNNFSQDSADTIRTMVKTAASSITRSLDQNKFSAGPIFYEPHARYTDLILIGASTGGTQAITALMESFPENSPPVLIVQHIPPVFSAAFADRLNQTTKLKVKEVENGDIVKKGHAYVAAGGTQMRMAIKGTDLVLEVTDDPPVNRHKPSVDYMFESARALPKSYRLVATLLTGMGADGARGLKELKDKGVYTVAEAEETCVVFGMPREAIKLGGATDVAPLYKIASKLFEAFRVDKRNGK